MNIHVHVYGQDKTEDVNDLQDNLEAEHDLELIEVYGEPESEGRYLQFGVEVEGKWVEIRVPQDEMRKYLNEYDRKDLTR